MKRVAPSQITPVILAGGSGTRRLWPLSSEERPKQFQSVAGTGTTLVQTLARITDRDRFAPPIIVGNARHEPLIRSAVEASEIEPAAVILESAGRNTAPAIAAAALLAAQSHLGETLFVMPADHHISDPTRLRAAIENALPAVEQGKFVTFGITPDGPQTSYGYIKQGQPATLAGNVQPRGLFILDSFVEKPPRSQAEAMLAAGGYLWNSGMFLFPRDGFLAALERLKPSLVAACRSALDKAQVSGLVIRLESPAFQQAEKISVDHAVMEHVTDAIVVPVDPGWSDVGSWTAVWRLSEHDAQGNATRGEVMLHEVRDSLVRSDGAVTAVIGLDGVIVINTPAGVIVASQDRAEDVRLIAEAMARRQTGSGQKEDR